METPKEPLSESAPIENSVGPLGVPTNVIGITPINKIMQQRQIWSQISKESVQNYYPRPQGHLPMYEYGINFGLKN